jgi:hypothetical protein
MLGLNQVGSVQRATQQAVEYPPIPQPSPLNQPTMESLRERAFSGFDSFLEPEPPRTGGSRVVLLIVLLAALGAAGWWTYNNYIAATQPRKIPPVTASTDQASPTMPQSDTTPSAQVAAPAVNSSSQSPTSSPVVPEGSSENQPVTAPQTSSPSPSTPKPTAPAPLVEEKRVAKREPIEKIAKPAPTPTPEPDTGDAAFRKGEAYLYGRGVTENCDEAVKNLKAASAKSNAKARSAFGTMYATGHCVPRDLPTSYVWFAMALRVDPNNQILEQDLRAVWNQMTPPERQLATRMKQ